MRRNRRGAAFLPVRVLLLATIAGVGCGPSGGDPAPGPALLPNDAVAQQQVLQRAGYGADAWSQARVEALGVEGYLEEQLAPATIDDGALEVQLAIFPSLEMSYAETLASYGDFDGALGDAFQPFREMSAAKIMRSSASRRQLEQVLVDFWFDHFNVFGADGVTNLALTSYEREAIRANVLGRFEDMLIAVSRHTAMLYYLDNYLSQKEGFEFEGQIRGINENFARELLELHTLGVDNGYTQLDIIEVARAFTGWTIGPQDFAAQDGFLFFAAAHDEDAKQVMELFLPPGRAMGDGLDVLRYLATHPNTARFVCGKLVARFVSEAPPEALVGACTDRFLETDGDLREVTRSVLFSREFFAAEHRGSKVKRPLHFMASLLRATSLPTDNQDVVQGASFYLGLLGEAPYQARPPTGYPDASEHWASGGALVTRFNLIELIASPEVAPIVDWGASGGSAATLVDGMAAALLPNGLSATSRNTIVAHIEALEQSQGLADPERIYEAGALILSAPDFMRH